MTVFKIHPTTQRALQAIQPSHSMLMAALVEWIIADHAKFAYFHRAIVSGRSESEKGQDLQLRHLEKLEREAEARAAHVITMLNPADHREEL